MKLYIILFFSFFLSAQLSLAQTEQNTLSAEQVLELVRRFHPVAKQAIIEIEKAKADILNARGNFDPIVQTYATQKTVDGSNYYTYTNPEINIPTWYGIEIHSGFENLSGNKINPTQTIGESNFLGISIPLAKDLVIDKRRAFLQQAKIFKKMAEAEQRAVINELQMEAMKAYWNWVKSYQIYQVIKNNVSINEQRVELVKKTVFNGERPAIDTIEAITQLQQFQYLQNEYWVQFQNAGLNLSAYLWNNNGNPYTLPENIIPSTDAENEKNILAYNTSLPDLLANADKNFPVLQAYSYKLDALKVNKKLKFQELLPKINFRYNQLGKGYDLTKSFNNAAFLENNFQYGIKFELPLRLSQGRAEYKTAKLKIEETKLDISQKQLDVSLKIKSVYNEWMNLKKQIELQTINYNYNARLVKAEETRFFNGESSLFVINSRETKSLEALEKLIALKAKHNEYVYTLQWSAGLLK